MSRNQSTIYILQKVKVQALEIPNQDILDFEYDDFTEDEEIPKTPTRPGGKSIRIDQPPTDLLDIPSSPTDSNIVMEEVHKTQQFRTANMPRNCRYTYIPTETPDCSE